MIECGIGDRVAFSRDGLEATGTIVQDYRGEFIIRLDDEFVKKRRGHDCNGMLGRYEGWYIYPEDVIAILRQPALRDACDISVEDLDSILNW